jgi:hypothetical protein
MDCCGKIYFTFAQVPLQVRRYKSGHPGGRLLDSSGNWAGACDWLADSPLHLTGPDFCSVVHAYA